MDSSLNERIRTVNQPHPNKIITTIRHVNDGMNETIIHSRPIVGERKQATKAVGPRTQFQADTSSMRVKAKKIQPLRWMARDWRRGL